MGRHNVYLTDEDESLLKKLMEIFGFSISGVVRMALRFFARDHGDGE